MNGTSGRNGIQGYGGFNFSEHNYQDHHTTSARANFVEQDRSSKGKTGKNPLNAPHATFQQKLPYDPNEINTWREQTLRMPPPGQVAGEFGRLPYGAADTSMLQYKLHHGFAQNDYAIKPLLNQKDIAPVPGAAFQFQSNPYIHSDVGIPSVVNQNMIETPTREEYPEDEIILIRGRHDHTNMKEHHTPTFVNESNISTGTHMTFGVHELQRRPLLLSDLPQPGKVF